MHNHIRELHGHTPLEWMKDAVTVVEKGVDWGLVREKRWNCHICGRACADERRLGSHVAKSHEGEKEVVVLDD
jgi:hypothetical protein